VGTCSVCNNKIFLNGYCKKHYIYLAKNDMLEKPVEEAKMVFSIIETRSKLNISTCKLCKREASTKGYCRHHYWILYENNMIGKSAEEINQFMSTRFKFESCLICGKKVYTKGFCSKHYTYLKKYNMLGKPIFEIRNCIVRGEVM